MSTDYGPVLGPVLAKGDYRGLWRIMESESRLPGPRANLELLYAFTDACMDAPKPELRQTLAEWLDTPLIDAPVNSAAEFPVACAAAGVAATLASRAGSDGEAIRLLTSASRSERWRTREAVVIGLQRRGYRAPRAVLHLLGQWAESGDPFLERAVLATLADPPLLKTPGMVDLAYATTERALERLQSLPVALRKTEGNRVLEKGLSYAISVFVASDPDRGFKRLERWLAQADRDTRRIIDTNLGKARLAKKFPAEVANLKGILFESDDWER